jgi:NADP-dependent aldehyde dehydrogenase
MESSMNTLQSFSARTGEPLGAPLLSSTLEQINSAAEAAAGAFQTWSQSDGFVRSQLLQGLASVLENDREALVSLADEETALGQVRLNGELDRTVYQLRRFADLCEAGTPYSVLDDPAVSGSPPLGHPAMLRQRVPLGPVAVFSASNFPFAFSVLGGDTASALAAGCPVVVKAHSGHLLLSNRVAGLIKNVLGDQKLPAGLISVIQGGGSEVGVHLIRHQAIAAGAFTGSTRGGSALQTVANSRPHPIPFYGELGSINPVVALPELLATKAAELSNMMVNSITLGCGQFCTSPGILVLLDDQKYAASNDMFVAMLAAALSLQRTHAMLTLGMRQSFDNGVAKLLAAGAIPLVREAESHMEPRPFLAQVSALQFVSKDALREEVFGPSCLVVRTESIEEVISVLNAVGGSLTVTLWGAETEGESNQRLVRSAMSIAGRVLFSGVPTGVAVTAAQQHGGPWPSSTNPMSTSVGDAALVRFLRPVCLQDAPAWLISRRGIPC